MAAVTLGNEFARVSRVIESEQKRIMGAWPRRAGQVSQVAIEAITMVTAELMFGVRERFTPRSQSDATDARRGPPQPGRDPV